MTTYLLLQDGEVVALVTVRGSGEAAEERALIAMAAQLGVNPMEIEDSNAVMQGFPGGVPVID